MTETEPTLRVTFGVGSLYGMYGNSRARPWGNGAIRRWQSFAFVGAMLLLSDTVRSAEPTAVTNAPAAPKVPAGSPMLAKSAAITAESEPVAAPERLKGVYKVRFPNADVSGRSYTSENVLEIVPYDGGAAYVRVRLEFYNGHTCALWGIARLEGEKLVYEERTPVDPARVCRLEVALKGADVIVADALAPDGSRSCQAHCGARGSMSAKWPYASRRAIRYMKILLNSREYKAAVAEFKDGAKPR